MNKSELLSWLATHLDNWPKTTQHSPLVATDWHWYRDKQLRAMVLRKNYADQTKLAYTIVKSEWWDEQNKTAAEAKPKPVVKNEAMLDIETFDTETSAIMFQAAITFFDKDHRIIYKEIWNLDFEEQLAAGRTVSGSTIAFHLGLPANAEEALKDKEHVSMLEFAKHLTENFEIFKPTMSWAKGDFDFRIVGDIFKHLGLEVPWKFWAVRELRTLMAECGVKKVDVAHNALADCLAQIDKLAQCRAVIQAGKDLLDLGKPVSREAEKILITDAEAELLLSLDLESGD